jgi:hypothetical protein
MNGQNLVIRGTPVSTGLVEAKVCIAKSMYPNK